MVVTYKCPGCGAAMESLLRIQSGQFTLENSVKLSEVQQYADEGRLEEIVIPADRLFAQYEKAVVTEAGETLLFNGNPMPISMLELETEPETLDNGAGVRIYDRSGAFIGLYRYGRERQLCRPEVLFLGKG